MQLFESVLVKSCTDVQLELKKVCDTYALEEHLISFDVLLINTLHRGEKKKDFSILPKEEYVKFLSDDSQYNLNDFEIKQVYDIMIRGLKENDLAPFVALQMDNECYELTLELKKGLEVRNDDAFFNELYAQITREKVLKHIIIRLFDEDTKKEIQALKDLLSAHGIRGTLESTQHILLTKATGFIPSMDARFQFSLQEEWRNTHGQNVDFASYAAKSGDLIGLSIKAQVGVSGRDLKGNYINAKKQENTESEIKLKFKDGECSSEEKDGAIAYYAAQDGYVSVSEGEIRMLVDLNFPEVSLRKNGSLLGGDKKGFAVEVTCADPNQDAIGAGIILEAEDVKIYGSVAENSRVVAKRVEINGQTHQSATVVADEISIDIHKGSAMGEKIHIKRLELGSVNGEDVAVEQVNGGIINAKNITIQALHSHLKATFSHNVYIKTMNGGENRFTFSSRASFKTQEEVQYMNAHIEHNIQQMNALLSVLNKDLALIRKTKPVVEKIKVIMEENKKNNKPNERNITECVAQYVILLRRSQYLKERLMALQNESKKLNAHLESLDKQTQDASITSDVPWQNENEIVYESFFPEEKKDVLLLSDGEDVGVRIDKDQLKLQKVARQ